jgi:hypothetical protein
MLGTRGLSRTLGGVSAYSTPRYSSFVWMNTESAARWGQHFQVSWDGNEKGSSISTLWTIELILPYCMKTTRC